MCEKKEKKQAPRQPLPAKRYFDLQWSAHSMGDRRVNIRGESETIMGEERFSRLRQKKGKKEDNSI